MSNNVIQYASERMNGINSKNTMEGIKEISAIDKVVQEAILTHMAEQDKIVDSSLNKTPIVTGEEIKGDVENGSYREVLER